MPHLHIKTSPWAVCAWVVLLALGCSGRIQTHGTGSGRPGSTGPGEDGSGDPASGAQGAQGNGPGGGGSGSGPGGAATDADPGRVTLHRLNRVEYTNTTRDLLGSSLRPADDFPTDDRGYGYDNIADVLSLSPVQIEMYFNAAQALIDEAMTVVQSSPRRFEAEAMQNGSGGDVYNSTAWLFLSAGSLDQSLTIETAGDYRLAIRGWAQQGGPDLAHATISVNGAEVAGFDISATESVPEVYEKQVHLDAGNATVSVAFTNDFYDQASGADRNLYVDWLEVEGPLGAQADNPLRARIMTCEPDKTAPEPCWREVAASFGRRAYRRPLAKSEIDGLIAVPSAAISAGDDVESATRLMLRTLLVSPQFIFRVEIDAQPAVATPHALSDYELASRLSYFLWSSMPDDTLLDLADAGGLHSDAALSTQVERMLKDKKADALVANFAGQWLFTRALDNHDADPVLFPSFDDGLRSAMRSETELFFREFLFGDETMDNLLTANFSFINDRLAQHYEMPAAGSKFARVALDGDRRMGLLTQASFLTVTAYPTRTSPVKRGKWVLEQLLCAPPPAPPPNVPPLVMEDKPSGSLRQRMEAHRANAVCASCHKLMDPIGFSFEHYDAIGHYRDKDDGFAIDDSGKLPDGTSFNGPLELAGLLTDDARFAHCIAQQLFTYALGRGPEAYDDDDLAAITGAFADNGYQLRDLIEQIVLSDAFRMRRGEPAKESP